MSWIKRLEDVVLGGCIMVLLLIMWLFNVDGDE